MVKKESPGIGIESPLSENQRLFPLPFGYDPAALADKLAAWLKTEREWETRVAAGEDGWLIEARDSGGTFRKLISRKAESLYILMNAVAGGLLITLGNGKLNGSGERVRIKNNSFWNLSSKALSAAADITDAAAAGISSFWLETRTGEAVFDFIAGHLASFCRAGMDDPDFSLSRFREEMSSLESAWLACWLEKEEIPLVWLQSSTEAPGTKEEWRYIQTTRRSVLAAFSKKRFLTLRELPAVPLSIKTALGRDMVYAGEFEWRTQLFNDAQFKEIAHLPGLEPDARLYEAARLCFLKREKNRDYRVYAESALERLTALGDDPLFLLSRLYVRLKGKQEKREKMSFDSPEVGGELKDVLSRLPEKAAPESLEKWAEAWGLNSWEKISLTGLIQKHFPDSAVLAELVSPMLEQARAALSREEKNKALIITAEIRYARNLAHRGKAAEAVELLSGLLDNLPDETLADLLPGRDTDLTKGEGGQLLKVMILEQLAEILGPVEGFDAFRQLAVLQPLVPARLRRLFEVGDARLTELVTVPLGILEGAGFEEELPGGALPDQGRVRTLEEQSVESRLRHPAGREGTAVGKMQSLIAAKNIPDHSALKAYAKRVTSENESGLALSIMNGMTMLGLKNVEAFISFGDLNKVIRGYDGRPPFLLIGDDLITPGSPLYLEPLELCFLIGSEMAHIKFKHERITSREVWEGAFNKALSLVELVPLVGGYVGKLSKIGLFAGQATEMAQRIGGFKDYVSQAREVAGYAQSLYKGQVKPPDEPDKKSPEEDLIGAFRVMQLTADRTGLVLCGDLRAALGAIFKSDPALNPESALVREHGLDRLLSLKDDQGDLRFQALAVRCAALFSFYLSEDYEKLRAEVFPGPGV